MAEDEPRGSEPLLRGAESGVWVRFEEREVWEKFAPKPGDVVEFEIGLVPGHEGSVGEAALMVTEVESLADGSQNLHGGFIGCSDETVSKALSSLINRRGGPLHLCLVAPCWEGDEHYAVHVAAARWFDRELFEASYMKPWGRLVLKEYGEMMAEKGKGDRKPALRRPATRGTPKAGPKKDDQARVRRRRKKDETADAGAGLREKLKALRGRLHRGEEPKKAEAILITESEESTEESSAAEETEEHVTRLSVGDKLARAELPALLDMKKERGAESPRRADPKKAKKKRKSPGDPQAQLLAQAAQTRALKVAADKKKKNKGSGGGSRKVKALVEALIEEKTGKEQKDAKKDSKKKKKKRRVQGGDDPGSSSSGDESDRDLEEPETDSSSSEMLAPLQKKSNKRPGAVLQMLVQHAKATLDQAAVVETEASKDVTGGVKLATYFNLMVRPYHSPNSRDMKELNHLAVCLDELRSGQLGRLGDSLAARFLAIHTAVNDGSWQSAQHLELHPLEAAQGAPMSLLLEARKHGRLVNRSQGLEPWRRGRGDGDGWRSSGKGGEGKGKGKNKGKDSAKGGGGGAQWQQGATWQKWQKGRNWWASQQDKTDGKDAKGASKEAKPGEK